MIEIEQDPWRTMVTYAERTYPNECCGAMLGTAGEKKVVTTALPLENSWQGSQGDHYEIRPQDLLRAEQEAQSRGLQLIGIFHSHPDCDAYFSETDLKNSCPWYSFAVLSVRQGRFDHARCFLPDPDQTEAIEEELKWPKS